MTCGGVSAGDSAAPADHARKVIVKLIGAKIRASSGTGTLHAHTRRQIADLAHHMRLDTQTAFEALIFSSIDRPLYDAYRDAIVWARGRGVGPQEISRCVEFRMMSFPLAFLFTHRLAPDYHVFDHHMLALVELYDGLGWCLASWSSGRSSHLIRHRSRHAPQGV